MKRVAIIGAGPMGLALAANVASWARPVVFEADDRVGGMSASFDFDGVRIERYYHFINRPDSYLFDLLRELRLENELHWRPTKMGFCRKDSDGAFRLHPWGNPVALFQLADIPLVTRFRYGLHAFSCKFLKSLDSLDAQSARDWITRWEGKAGYDVFWRFLFEKKFFELADPLSAAWIASRIRRVANSRDSLTQESLGYLENGSEVLLQALVLKIREKGGDVRLSSRVKRVTPDAANGGGTLYTDAGEESFDAIVSTVPLPYLLGIIPELPEAILEKIRMVKNIGCACALFRLREPLTENFWVNIDVAEWDIPGVIEYSNLRPMGAAYVYVPFYMPHTHPNWTTGDEALLAKARACLAGINPSATVTEEAARIFRYEYAQPVCPPGFGAMLPPYESGIRNVLLADTSHSYPEDRSINESIRIAEELAQKLGHELTDL